MVETLAYGTDSTANGEPEPQLTPNALAVLEKRYLNKDDSGKAIETPREMFWRVAWNLAQAEKKHGADEAKVLDVARQFYRLMAELDFLPNSPTLMNAGLPLQQLSACFVLPVEDSLTGIFDTLKHQALIHQSGGGTGFSFSRLRPKGDTVRSTMGVASGPVSFMKIFDAATQTVKQGGKRRGANMGILRVDHPDILDFITCKDDLSQVTNFNISVAVTDKFMEAVKTGGAYDLLNPRTKKAAGQRDAREIFDKIAFQAWKNGEPGLFFLDITNATNPCPHIADFEATNPCVTGDTLVVTAEGLVPIAELAGRTGVEIDVDVRAMETESNLLQVGTARAVATRVWKTGVRQVFRLVTRSGKSVKATSDHRFLTLRGWRPLGEIKPGDTVLVQSAKGEDKVIAIETLAEEEVYDLSEPSTHSFIANGFVTHNCGEQPLLPYESCNLGSINLDRFVTAGKKPDVDWTRLETAVRGCVRLLDNVIDQNAYPVKEIEDITMKTRKIGLGVMGFARLLFRLGIRYDSQAGVDMGRKVMKFVRDKGYDESQVLAKEKGPYPAWPGSRHHKMGLLMRNSYVTTVAPTGTLSMIADTSGGCEPEFSLIWYKNVMDGTHLPYVLDQFIEVAKAEGWWREDLLDKILKNHGSARGVPEVPKKWQEVFTVSFDVSPEWHVRMQAAFQENSDSAVSKTINLPSDATAEDVKKAYLLAYELRCKGITVYRDGSRNDQVLNVGVSEKGKGGAETKKVEVPQLAAVMKPRPRPDVITGRTQKIMTGYGALYVTVNEDEQGLFEIFAQTGRGGGYTASFTEGIARLVSLCLRSGVPAEEIIDQLEGIRSPRMVVDQRERVFSIPDAVAKALKRHIGMSPAGVQVRVDSFANGDTPTNGHVEMDDELEKESLNAIVKHGLNPECPECQRVLTYEEGCVKCLSCGYSEC